MPPRVSSEHLDARSQVPYGPGGNPLRVARRVCENVGVAATRLGVRVVRECVADVVGFDSWHPLHKSTDLRRSFQMRPEVSYGLARIRLAR